MVLTTHGLVGGALVALFPVSPALTLPAALVSHYLLDALPHWDYPLPSLKNPAASRPRDMFKVVIDGMLGLLLPSIVFFQLAAPWWILAGAMAAILPDFLQFIFYKFKFFWVVPLQRFHGWWHAKRRLNDCPVLGVSLQLALILAVIALVYYI